VPTGDPFRREKGRLGPRQARLASNRDVGSRLHGEAEGTGAPCDGPDVPPPVTRERETGEHERRKELGGHPWWP